MLTVMGAPIDSVAHRASGPPHGCERAPQVLRSAGLVPALGARDAGDLDVEVRGYARDATTGVVAWPGVRDASLRVREAVRTTLEAGDQPVLLGGCCAIVPGALAGARDVLGTLGLAYVDGHHDSYDGHTSPTGEAADMPIAVIAGYGPRQWHDLLAAPLVAEGGLVLLGPNDRQESLRNGCLLPEAMGHPAALDPHDLRDAGPGRSGRDAEIALTTHADAFWLHLDVDVLDAGSMPATDYPGQGGLSWDELTELLEPLGHSDALVGFSVGCFNPDKDPDHALAARLNALIIATIGSGAQ